MTAAEDFFGEGDKIFKIKPLLDNLGCNSMGTIV